MGSTSRAARAERYIKEFDDDYIKTASLKAGIKLEVVRLGLGQEEGHAEQVKLYVVCKDEAGKEHTLDIDMVFDPEYDHGVDMLERVANHLGIPEDEAKERLKKAKLL